MTVEEFLELPEYHGPVYHELQDRRQIKVSTPDGLTLTYRSGQEIPLPFFGNTAVAVDAILG